MKVKGFTLIELMIVISIIGIIIIAFAPIFMGGSACDARGMDYSYVRGVCIADDGTMHDPVLYNVDPIHSSGPVVRGRESDAAAMLCGGDWVSIDKGSYSTIYTCSNGKRITVDN